MLVWGRERHEAGLVGMAALLLNMLIDPWHPAHIHHDAMWPAWDPMTRIETGSS